MDFPDRDDEIDIGELSVERLREYAVSLQQSNRQLDERIKQLIVFEFEATQEMQLLRNQLTAATTERDSHSERIQVLTSRLDTAIYDRDYAVAQNAPLNERIAQLETELDTAQQKNTELENELLSCNNKLLDADATIVQLNADIEQKLAEYEQQVEQMNLDFKADRDQLLAEHQVTTDELEQKVSQIKNDAGAESTLEDFIQTTNQNLAKVQQSLQAQGGSYHLGPIEMDLKVLPGMGGNGISLPMLSDLKQVTNDHLSTIKVQFVPNQKNVHDEPDSPDQPTLLVPQVFNSTATHAKRKIEALGLSVKLVQQLVEQEHLAGRVVNQLPLPDQEYPSDGVLTLWIGKYVDTTIQDSQDSQPMPSM